MTDERIVEYLRSRGRADPPADLVRAVMSAVDATPGGRPGLAAFVPAAAVAGIVAIVAAVAILFGQGLNVGPGPDPSPSSPAPTSPASVDDLITALTGATEVAREAAGVEGWQESRIRGELASATWFDWRLSGDVVVVQREDLDVTQTGWWLDPAGVPPATGRQVVTHLAVVVGDQFHAGGPEGWTVMDRDEAPPALAFGVGILDGAIEPWQPLAGMVMRAPDPEDGKVTHLDHADGGSTWTLEVPYLDGIAFQVWTIAAAGDLRSWSWELVGVSPEPDHPFWTSASLKLLPREDADPIALPDLDAPPDPTDFGLPADMPLGDPRTIDYRAYVEDALDTLEAYHWNSANIDWAAARSAALDGLPQDPTGDQAHARIRRAIETFDAFNTVFVRPQDVPPGGMGNVSSDPSGLPAGERFGDIGVVSLPTPPTDETDAFVDYLETAWAAMATVEDSALACGWMVDLRDYDGFAWGPPMYAVGGLVGDGRVATFRSPAGEWWLEVDDRGVISSGGFDETDDPIDSSYIETFRGEVQRDLALAEAIAALSPYLPSTESAPVAVLVGNATRSGGEQTLVALIGREATRTFGGPTTGTPIVAPNYRMVDGAVLRIPTWVPVDRTGTEHTINITPDEVVGDTRASGGDAIRDAAIDWLEAQPGCS